MRLHKSWAIFLSGLLLLALSALANAQPARIGDAAKVVNSVTGEIGTRTVQVQGGDTVFRDQRILTKSKSSAQFRFLDDTYLAVGENASIILDKFVYAGTPPSGEVTLTLTKGAFRFITGKLPSRNYRINTPTGVIGVRGTTFDVYVGARGETLVILLDGAVQFCDLTNSCLDLTNQCEAAAVGAGGNLASARRLNDALLGEIDAEQAAPFILDQSDVLPEANLPGTVIADCMQDIVASRTRGDQDGGVAPPPAVQPNPPNPGSSTLRRCPKGKIRKGNRCVRKPRVCPRGTVYRKGRCREVRRECPRGTVYRKGRCRKIRRECPRGTVYRKGRCRKIVRECPRGTVYRKGRCRKIVRKCPRGTIRRGNRCVRVKPPKIRCPWGTIPAGNICIRIRIPIPGSGGGHTDPGHGKPSKPTRP